MPSPRTSNGLELLARKTRLEKEEWYDLIEARRALIDKHLDSFTLLTIGDLNFLKQGWQYSSSYSTTHSLSLDSPYVSGDRGCSLKTQGIFRCPRSGIRTIPSSGFQPHSAGIGGDYPDGVAFAWGLTRFGFWVLIEVEFEGKVAKGDENEGYGYQEAKAVTIHSSDVEKIIAETGASPLEIWKELGDEVRRWADNRKRLYEEALALAQQVMAEEMAYSIVSER